jgi:hypothetical protein
MLRSFSLLFALILACSCLGGLERAIPFEGHALAAFKTECGMAFWAYRDGGLAYWLQDEERGFLPLGQAWIGAARILKKASGRGYLAYLEGKGPDGAFTAFVADADARASILSIERHPFDAKPVLHRFEMISATKARLFVSSGRLLMQCSLAIEESGRARLAGIVRLSERYIEGSPIAAAMQQRAEGLATVCLFKESYDAAAFSMAIADDASVLEARRAFYAAEGAEAALLVADGADPFPLAIIAQGGAYLAIGADGARGLPESIAWTLPGELAARGQNGRAYAAFADSGRVVIRGKDAAGIDLEGARLVATAAGFVAWRGGDEGLELYSSLARDAFSPLLVSLPGRAALYVEGAFALAVEGGAAFLCDLPTGLSEGPFKLSAAVSRRIPSPPGSLCLALEPSAKAGHGSALYIDEEGL